ncbi:hypothetical protein CR513_29274, partial [Mucuna pruriens]
MDYGRMSNHLRLGSNDLWYGAPGRGRGRSCLRVGEREEIERVETTEATEREDHGSQLLLPAASVCPLLGADEFPEPLVLRRLVPLFVHATRHRQRPRVHVFQHLEQEIVVETRQPVTVTVATFHRLRLLHLPVSVRRRRTLHGWNQNHADVETPFCRVSLAVPES